MVKILKCSYCGKEIHPGTGTTYVKNDGTIYQFCTKKCKTMRLKYRKPARKVRWTNYFGEK
ncbi:MAG: 50S ribosomal protein L24e [Candidatus Lokiarchaeota archaeon]|nr:50S ribosomal protein L24e [Candidatus Harpocratesius repetitus]